MLRKAAAFGDGATVLFYPVKDPERFGIVKFDNSNKVLSIEEKPATPKSKYAVTGLYFYDNDVIEIAKTVEPSYGGELEISCVNEQYLKHGKMNVGLLGRGFTCLEEISWRNKWISTDELLLFDDSLGMKFPVNDYKILAQKIYSVLYSKDSSIAPSPTIEKIAKSYYKNFIDIESMVSH